MMMMSFFLFRVYLGPLLVHVSMNCVLRNGFGRFFNDTEGLSICQGPRVLIAMPPCSCCDSRISFWLCNMILTV